MLTVNVELGERGYPIVIGAGLLGDQGLAARIGQEVLRQGKIVIVTDDADRENEGDLVLAMGAGDVNGLWDRLGQWQQAPDQGKSARARPLAA